MSGNDVRSELAQVAASLRAYLETQVETGAWGIPRGGARRAPAESAPSAALPVDANAYASQAQATLTAASTPAATTAPPPAAPHPPVPVPAPAPVAAPAPVVAAPVAAAPARPELSSPPPPRSRLPVLAAEVAQCTKCSLAATRTQTVFARGNPEAHLCIVGEAPGADEDAQGLPFVGRAGQLLDKMIAAMGLDPARDVYICNILKCRPPGNRRPEPNETESCIPYLHEQLAIVQPKAIVAMGNSAVQALLGTKLGITKVRGSWKLYKGTTLVMPTYHPSFLLRPGPMQADAKKQAWEDLQQVMKELGLPPRKPSAST